MLFKRCLALLLILGPGSVSYAAEKWQGGIPKIAAEADAWKQLIPELLAQNMPYGALAASRNVLNFFSDLGSKELAYGTIIKVIDAGFPFSTRAEFVPGDIDPSGRDNFSQSYLLYKGIVNLDKKMEKWADYYFEKIDKDHFPKYLFFRANLSYRKGERTEAIEILKKALAATTGPENLSLAKKEARTLARLYYETQEFEKSLEIYQSFLLKMNPIEPTDWLEAAWNLYQLKRFPEAHGMLYNLESTSAGETVKLEKYVLRALIYREYCSVESTEKLIESFNRDFGSLIDGIKMGEALARFQALTRIDHPEAQDYRHYIKTIDSLAEESSHVKKLPAALRDLAQYVYKTEMKVLKRKKRLFEEKALAGIARHLVILGESLRFLKFDVAREKYNPDRVFIQTDTEKQVLVENTEGSKFLLHWIQWGDYWRDERMIYRGILINQCEP